MKVNMLTFDEQITSLKIDLDKLDEQRKGIEAQIRDLKEQKTKSLEDKWGVKRGEFYHLSPELRADLASRNWWTALNHGGYDPFKIQDLGETSLYIEDRMGGATGVPYELAVVCEKVEHAHG